MRGHRRRLNWGALALVLSDLAVVAGVMWLLVLALGCATKPTTPHGCIDACVVDRVHLDVDCYDWCTRRMP